jgi:hypothetical protein
VWLQGLELLVTVLLARNRQPPPTVAAGVPHAELAAELVSLPSGLLAMVCEAIVKLKVRRGSCVCVRSCGCIGDGRGPTRSRRVHGAGHECWRPCSPRVGPTVCGVHEALRVVTFAAGFRCGPVSDVEGSRASGDGAPPWAGATWTARLRSAVSEIRRQKSQIQLLLCSESPLLPSSVVYETWRSSWFHAQRERGLPVDGAASGFDHSCCAVLRRAIGTGARPDSDCTGPFKLT